MKKYLSLLLSLCLVLALAACSDGDDGVSGGDASGTPAESTTGEEYWESKPLTESSSGNRYKYYYSQLDTAVEKHSYNMILGEIFSFPELIEIPALNQDKLTNVFQALVYDNPELFFVGRSGSINEANGKNFFRADYEYDDSDEAETKHTELINKANAIISAMPAGYDEQERERYIHDYIVANCRYENDTSDNNSNAYGALVEGVAACEGYSKAFLLLADMAGLDALVITGDATNRTGATEEHMWNVVKVDDGYYHVDVTWDDPLAEDGEGEGEPRFTYYNLTDTEISRTHSKFNCAFACAATDNNYFVLNDLHYDYYDYGVRDDITEKLVDIVADGGDSIEVKFASRWVYSQAYEDIFTNENIYSMLGRIQRATGKNVNTHSVNYVKNETFNIIEFLILFEEPSQNDGGDELPEITDTEPAAEVSEDTVSERSVLDRLGIIEGN